MSDVFSKLKGGPFSKSKDGAENDANLAANRSAQPVVATSPEKTPGAAEGVTSISSGITIEGQISGDGTVKIFGRIKGELIAPTVLISDGAQVEGNLIADELTIAGQVTGTIHANRVKISGSAAVAGDIYHRSLAIEENARFEGTSRREESALDVPARIQAIRAQTQPRPIASETSRTRSGNLEKEQHVQADAIVAEMPKKETSMPAMPPGGDIEMLAIHRSAGD